MKISYSDCKGESCNDSGYLGRKYLDSLTIYVISLEEELFIGCMAKVKIEIEGLE